MNNTYFKSSFCQPNILCFRSRTAIENLSDFVLENNEEPHLINRNIPTVCISDSFGNIIHFHDSPTQSFITSCAVKITYSSTEAATSPQDNLDNLDNRERPASLLMDHSRILALVQCMCKLRLCGPTEWRTSMTEPVLQRQRAGFIPLPATARDQRTSFSRTITRCTPGNVTLFACIPKALVFLFFWRELCHICSICVGFQLQLCEGCSVFPLAPAVTVGEPRSSEM